jgi:CRISPR-associated endonuclease Cas1/CRISPR-associated protein Cas4
MSQPEKPRAVPELVPARMLNEFAYCPRLAYLMWVQREWAENVETLEGKHAHRRVDKEPGERAVIHDRSVQLTSAELGLTAVLDLVERDGRRARPVDYKRGKRPPVAEGAYEPERVQLCAQGLLLREHGYVANEGLIYYVASKERVRIRFTQALVERTLELLAEMRQVLGGGSIPPPLEDSPKCPRCSLVSICLPEEVRFLREGKVKPRPLAVGDPGTYPLVVQDPRAGVRLEGERLLVETPGGERTAARLVETSHLVLMGGARCSMPALHECCRREIPVVHMSGTGWFYGITRGLGHKNVELRSEQFAAARDSERSLAVARAVVAAKIRNARVLLRRNGNASRGDLGLLAGYARRALGVPDAEELLGLEGNAAKIYYGGFSSMLKATGGDGFGAFDFEGRNRRPPRDPINALLSFAYSLLTKDWVVTLTTVGLDPLMGFYHQPRYGKPALALDLMEPFRPVIADSTVVSAVNNGEIQPGDFVDREGGVLLRPAARKRLIAAYERRLAQKVRHPLFSYRCSYRRLFELEARLLSRYLLGEVPAYQPFEVR